LGIGGGQGLRSGRIGVGEGRGGGGEGSVAVARAAQGPKQRADAHLRDAVPHGRQQLGPVQQQVAAAIGRTQQVRECVIHGGVLLLMLLFGS